MLGASALSLVLMSPAPQLGNSTATKVQEAFSSLEYAWSRDPEGRPKLAAGGWGIVGGFIGPGGAYRWSVPFNKDQTVSYAVVGDNRIKTFVHEVVESGGKDPEFTQTLDEPYLTNYFTAPKKTRYTFVVRAPKGITSPVFAMIAFKDSKGRSISTVNLAQISEAVGTVVKEATGPELNMVMPLNSTAFYGGVFGTNQSRSVTNLPKMKLPWIVIGAMENEREGLQLSVKDKDGNVLGRDPDDEPFAYVVGEREMGGGSFTISSQSAKARFGFVTTFQAK